MPHRGGRSGRFTMGSRWQHHSAPDRRRRGRQTRMTGRSPGAVLPLFYGSEEFAQPGFLADAAEPSDGQLRSGGQLRRNLFGPAAESEIYRGLGPSPEQRRATRHMMRELAVHMKLCQWPGAKHSLDNPEIPAGYTYLAQLAAHDIVSNTAPLPRLDDPPTFFARDYRIDRLTLETIYGAGPAMTPLPFAIDGGDVKEAASRSAARPCPESRAGGQQDRPSHDGPSSSRYCQDRVPLSQRRSRPGCARCPHRGPAQRRSSHHLAAHGALPPAAQHHLRQTERRPSRTIQRLSELPTIPGGSQDRSACLSQRHHKRPSKAAARAGGLQILQLQRNQIS